ncbi:hypothetical protein WJX72_000068 [[Myrmecia] bisecta]|uniref:U3 small nucleolar RNA-associated protein 15 C-terminal domain-containing protein n=1 Tax=[Myrmecia] bisecta TaxID=41462 RepID=A0AAW1PXL7_9CHLO
MDYEPTDYKKLAIRQYPARDLRETAEGKYWRQFKEPVVVQQVGAVSHIDFSRQYPYHFAITSSTRVIVYDTHTRRVRRQFTRFKDKAYSGNFRIDGKAIVAGSEDGLVQVFDSASRTLLRQLKGPQRPTHVAQFSSDKVHVLSGSDDATVRWWDVTMGEQVCRLDGHSDYVRAAAASPVSADMWATGGYDHICKLWDVRSSECTMNLDHGSPIEDVAFFPSGSLIATAGGNSVCIWDMLSGGKLLRRLANHQKTVTCVCLSPMAGPASAAAPRMLTGSLDGHVKVFELDTFTVTHATKYTAPILSLGLSPDCGLLAVGMADGYLSIRKHSRPKEATGPGVTGRPAKRERYKPRLTAATYRYFLRGQNEKAAEGDFKVAARRRARLAPYDQFLRKFHYREALDAALDSRQPEVVASVLEELAARSGLNAALGGRDAEGLLPVLAHLDKYIREPRYARLLIGVAHRILDAYASAVGASREVDELLLQLRQHVHLELRLQADLRRIQGMMEPILAASLASGEPQLPEE